MGRRINWHVPTILGAAFVVTQVLPTATYSTVWAQQDDIGSKAANKVTDPSFEDGSKKWKDKSTFYGFVICDGTCDGSGFHNHARTGDWWAWFAGNSGSSDVSKLSQKVRFPDGGAGTLAFYLHTEHHSGNGLDQFRVYVDKDRVFKTNDNSTKYDGGYKLVQIDAGAYCDGNKHKISFKSKASGSPSYVLWAVDDVSLTKS